MGRNDVPAVFTIGDWTVRPSLRTVERSGERKVLEPKLIDVLTYLAGTAGAVVDKEQLLTDCWRGTFYGDNPVHKTIALIRKALGDDAKRPRYIATIRKRGYRVIAKVGSGGPQPRSTRRTAVSSIYRIALRSSRRIDALPRRRLLATVLIGFSAFVALCRTSLRG